MTEARRDLDVLLAAAQDADPATRIELRDEIAAHGEHAIEAMTDWLDEPRMGAFAVRVLERLARDANLRSAVIATLRAVDRAELAEPVARDVDGALAALGADRPTPRGRGGSTGRPIGLPGTPGQRYWVMRTSSSQRPRIWAEARRGRLRQGWGWDDSQNLDVIAKAVRAGVELNEHQRVARRARLMRSQERGGIQLGDRIVAPNMPEWGVLCIFEVTSGYAWDPIDGTPEDRFGHVLGVALLAERIDRRSSVISDALRAMLRPQTRLYNIDNVGGDVDLVVTKAGVR